MGKEQLNKIVYKICPAYSHCSNECKGCPFGNLTTSKGCLHATQPESFPSAFYHVVAVKLTILWADFFEKNLGVSTFLTKKDATEFLVNNYNGRYIL